jgi:hypothetical protein
LGVRERFMAGKRAFMGGGGHPAMNGLVESGLVY